MEKMKSLSQAYDNIRKVIQHRTTQDLIEAKLNSSSVDKMEQVDNLSALLDNAKTDFINDINAHISYYRKEISHRRVMHRKAPFVNEQPTNVPKKRKREVKKSRKEKKSNTSLPTEPEQSLIVEQRMDMPEIPGIM
jgi:hypothetical protein